MILNVNIKHRFVSLSIFEEGGGIGTLLISHKWKCCNLLLHLGSG